MVQATTAISMLLLSIAIGAATGADGAGGAGQKIQPSLEAVLEAVGAYVRQYEASFSAVVSHEHYVQRARGHAQPAARQLRSDVALIAAGDGTWLFYRDVYEVDGKAVRDRADRLADLFKAPKPDAALQARTVLEESARSWDRSFEPSTHHVRWRRGAAQSHLRATTDAWPVGAGKDGGTVRTSAGGAN